MWVPLAEATPDDDVLHQPGVDPAWSEHHYFFFADASGVAGGCRVAWRVGDGVSKGMLFCFLPGGVGIWQEDGGDDRLAVGPLSLSGKSLGEWRVRFEGDVLVLPDGLALSGLRDASGDMTTTSLSLDLRFRPVSPAVEASPGDDAVALVKRIAPRRFEQAGRYDGTARVGAETISWSGWGTRDHSWGSRGAEGLREWKWCALPLDDAFCAGAGHVSLDDGEIRSGWLAEGGRLVDVGAASVEYAFDDTGAVPASARLTWTTADGTRRAEGRVVTPLGMRVVEHGRPVLAVESLARWHGDDGTTGYGIIEYIRAD